MFGVQRQAALADREGRVLKLDDFHKAGRALLAQRLGMPEADLFTSYALRRSMPTLAEVRHVSQDDRAPVW